MNYEEFSSTKEFQNLHPVKQQIIKEVLQNSNLTSPEALLPKFMTINKELSKRNLNFTKDETSLLITVMKANMSPAEQAKVDMVLNMFYR